MQGKVTLQVQIDKADIPQDIVVVKGLGYGCDEEAIRVMRAARYSELGSKITKCA